MLEIITAKDHCRWKKITNQFNGLDTFYFLEYVQAWGTSINAEPLLFYYTNHCTQAVNVILVRDVEKSDVFKGRIRPNNYFDIISPYGYGGFIIEGQNYDSLESEYIGKCKELGFISEFVRFNLFSKYKNVFNGELVELMSNVIRPVNLPLEDIIRDFEHKVRKNIKRAQKHKLYVSTDKGENFSTFFNIFNATLMRNNAQHEYFFKREFFDQLNILKDNIQYFYVHDENGEVISTELVLYSDTTAYSYLGGTLAEYFEKRPNDFLKFEIMKWAKNQNITNFVLGGGYGKEDGIFKYKKSFSPCGIVPFYIGKRIFNQEKYTKLLEIRKKHSTRILNENFFPLYRA